MNQPPLLTFNYDRDTLAVSVFSLCIVLQT